MRVLVVDDSKAALAACRDDLEDRGWVAILAAPRDPLRSAMLLVAEHRPDVIVSDVEMGVQTGFDLAALLGYPAPTTDTPPLILHSGASGAAFEVWQGLAVEFGVPLYAKRSEALWTAVGALVATGGR